MENVFPCQRKLIFTSLVLNQKLKLFRKNVIVNRDDDGNSTSNTRKQESYWLNGENGRAARAARNSHFTVVCLVTWPMNESEAEVDLVLIETSLLFLCKFLLISTTTSLT